jgi:translation initiation factor 2B subunit (eIF-2B alpha/beta/delta family)
VLCDTSKFNVLNYLGAKLELEEKTPDEVTEPIKNVTIKNPYFEVVPPELITGVITEEGLMEPLDIRQKMESMRKYVEPLYTADK